MSPWRLWPDHGKPEVIPEVPSGEVWSNRMPLAL